MFIILINIKEVGDWFMRINIYYDEVFVKYEIFLNRNKSWLVIYSFLFIDNWY